MTITIDMNTAETHLAGAAATLDLIYTAVANGGSDSLEEDTLLVSLGQALDAVNAARGALTAA